MVAWSPGGLRGGGPSATGACYQNGTATARAKTAGSSTTVRSESRARNFKLTHYPAFQGLKLIRTCSPRVSPRLRASASRSIPPLDAIPTRTEQSASRYVQNMPTSISSLFNNFQIRNAEIVRLLCYTGSVGAVSCTIHRRAPPHAPAPPSASVQPVCVTKVCAVTASRRKRMF
jgi:hypothetical protein